MRDGDREQHRHQMFFLLAVANPKELWSWTQEQEGDDGQIGKQF